MRFSGLMTNAARCGLLTGVLAAVAMPVGAGQAHAGERRELPPAMVSRADGTPVAVPALAAQRAWLLIFVDADAPGSRRLLDALEAWALGPRAAQVVIVLQGPASGVAAAVTEWQSKLPGVTVTTDAKGAARQALRVKAVPTVIGARGVWVEWQIAGVLNDPEMLRQVVVSWLADDRPPA